MDGSFLSSEAFPLPRASVGDQSTVLADQPKRSGRRQMSLPLPLVWNGRFRAGTLCIFTRPRQSVKTTLGALCEIDLSSTARRAPSAESSFRGRRSNLADRGDLTRSEHSAPNSTAWCYPLGWYPPLWYEASGRAAGGDGKAPPSARPVVFWTRGAASSSAAGFLARRLASLFPNSGVRLLQLHCFCRTLLFGAPRCTALGSLHPGRVNPPRSGGVSRALGLSAPGTSLPCRVATGKWTTGRHSRAGCTPQGRPASSFTDPRPAPSSWLGAGPTPCWVPGQHARAASLGASSSVVGRGGPKSAHRCVPVTGMRAQPAPHRGEACARHAQARRRHRERPGPEPFLVACGRNRVARHAAVLNQ